MSSKSPDCPANADPQSKGPFMLHSLLPTYNHRKEVLSRINGYLSRASDRLEGLQMLYVLITGCTNADVSANYVTWLTYCCPQPRDDLKEIKLRVIRKIITVSCNVQDFNRKFVVDYIAKVVDVCISSHVDLLETDTALETLSVCMKHYGSWFTVHREKIEKYLLTFLDSGSRKVVRSAAEAFLHLQQTGGAGAEGINHARNFSSSFRKLCVTTHKLFDVLFEHETEIEKYTLEEEEGFVFKDPLASSDVTAQRIQNLSVFLEVMMLKGFPVVKEIKPVDVLNIVERGVHMHICCESEKSYQFALLLMKVQISLLRLMDTFIIWSGTNCLPFCHKITKILIDCLETSQKCQCFTVDSEFQQATYKCLNTWIAVVRCGFHENFQAKLVSCILKDISPIKSQITLTVSSNSKHKSGKARKKAVQESVISTGSSQTDMLNLNEKSTRSKICRHSLETLKHVLNHTDLKVDKLKLQELYHVLFEAVDSITTAVATFPYTDPECQIKLFEVLPTFYEQNDLPTLPPLQLTLSLLNRGLESDNFQVSDVCKKGISTLEKICQPVCPSLEIGRKTDVIGNGVNDVVDVTLIDEDVLSHNDDCDDEVILNKFGVTNIIPVEPEHDDKLEEQNTSTINILDVQVINVQPDQHNGEQPENPTIEFNQDTPTIEEVVIEQPPTDDTNVTPETQPENLGEEPPSKVPKLDAEPTEEPLEDSFIDVINEY